MFGGLVIAVLFASGARGDDPAPPQFEKDVQPLLRTYCWKCHGGEGYAAELDMRSLPLIMKGGKSGTAIERGSAEKSRLYQRLAAKEMPPGGALKPTDAHVATIKAWLDAGAPAKYEGGGLTEDEAPPLTSEDRAWWAFKKPVGNEPPAVKNADRVATPIDAFLLAKLEEKGLSFSPEADRLALVRRVHLDLTGLPPSPEDIEAYLADAAPGAYERLIDRLLESPQYGERWGRHWLDAAGYVDTIGADNDADIINLREGIWQYRDFVVRSFNADKPYDRFLLEQLAGDELVDWRNAPAYTPELKELLVATGFLRLSADDTNSPELNTADIRHRVLFETLQTFSSNVLGLTIHCAQCHSHKFDPISQADFYRLVAVFSPAYNVQSWKHSGDRFQPDVPASEQAQIAEHNANVDKQVAELNAQIAALRKPFEQKVFEEKLAKIPEPIRADTKAAVETPAEKRNEIQKFLAEKLGPSLAVKPEEAVAAFDEPTKQAVADLQQKIGAAQGSKKGFGKIQALWDVGPAPIAYLYRRGAFENPGAAVTPAVPAVLEDAANPFAIAGGPQGGSTTGYRTALARWLGRPENPLTARVIVNRVWQQYFGRGIVATPDNFGHSGVEPTHPELLDWLATEFVRNGWKFKPLHRLILTSSVYKQQSRAPAGERLSAAMAADPDNLLLWRMPLRRLESEVIRDGVLAISGKLDRTAGGPPLPIKSLPDGMVVVETEKLPPGANPFRRSMYLVSRRNYHPTELGVFDQPTLATNCTRRTNAAVALQSLTMLNGQFVMEQAEHFAARVIAAAGPEESRRIERAWLLALSRPPSADEIVLAKNLLAKQSQRYQEQEKVAPAEATDKALVNLCQMLLNTNEFLYAP